MFFKLLISSYFRGANSYIKKAGFSHQKIVDEPGVEQNRQINQFKTYHRVNS